MTANPQDEMDEWATESDSDDDYMDDDEFKRKCENDVGWYAYEIIPEFGKSLKEMDENVFNIPPRPRDDGEECNR